MLSYGVSANLVPYIFFSLTIYQTDLKASFGNGLSS